MYPISSLSSPVDPNRRPPLQEITISPSASGAIDNIAAVCDELNHGFLRAFTGTDPVLEYKANETNAYPLIKKFSLHRGEITNGLVLMIEYDGMFVENVEKQLSIPLMDQGGIHYITHLPRIVEIVDRLKHNQALFIGDQLLPNLSPKECQRIDDFINGKEEKYNYNKVSTSSNSICYATSVKGAFFSKITLSKGNNFKLLFYFNLSFKKEIENKLGITLNNTGFFETYDFGIIEKFAEIIEKDNTIFSNPSPNLNISPKDMRIIADFLLGIDEDIQIKVHSAASPVFDHAPKYRFQKIHSGPDFIGFKASGIDPLPLISRFNFTRKADGTLTFSMSFFPESREVLEEYLGFELNDTGEFSTDNVTMFQAWTVIYSNKDIFIGQEENKNLSPREIEAVTNFIQREACDIRIHPEPTWALHDKENQQPPRFIDEYDAKMVRAYEQSVITDRSHYDQHSSASLPPLPHPYIDEYVEQSLVTDTSHYNRRPTAPLPPPIIDDYEENLKRALAQSMIDEDVRRAKEESIVEDYIERKENG